MDGTRVWPWAEIEREGQPSIIIQSAEERRQYSVEEGTPASVVQRLIRRIIIKGTFSSFHPNPCGIQWANLAAACRSCAVLLSLPRPVHACLRPLSRLPVRSHSTSLSKPHSVYRVPFKPTGWALAFPLITAPFHPYSRFHAPASQVRVPVNPAWKSYSRYKYLPMYTLI